MNLVRNIFIEIITFVFALK